MIDIRLAQAPDVAQICAFDHLAERADRETFIENAVRSGTTWVADVSGQAIAYMVFEYTFFSNGFIALLYVSQHHRRKGIGSELMRHAESICRTEKLFTSTNESNVIMQSLLDKLDYAPSGVIDNLDEGDPELVYFKRLDKGR